MHNKKPSDKKLLYNLFYEKGDFTPNVAWVILQYLPSKDLLSILKVGFKKSIWKKISGIVKNIIGTGNIGPIIEQIPKIQNVAYKLLEQRWKPTQIVCGGAHTMVLMKDGTILSCGRDDKNQLGRKTNVSGCSDILQPIMLDGEAKQVACGTEHTIILMNDGTVRSVGENMSGQLGREISKVNYIFNQITLRQINLKGKAKQVACGDSHTVILMKNGSVWSCGANNAGQLGRETDKGCDFLLRKVNLYGNNAKQVVCGALHTFVLMENGSVWSCGANNDGQLGDNRHVGTSRSNFDFQQIDLHGNRAKQIACGNTLTVILTEKNVILSCGSNRYGQLGSNRNFAEKRCNPIFQPIIFNSIAKQIFCGDVITWVLTNNGAIFMCGDRTSYYNHSGCTNIPYTEVGILQQIDFRTHKVSRVANGTGYTVILLENGRLLSRGINTTGQLGRNEISLFYGLNRNKFDGVFRVCYDFKSVIKKIVL
jgi:alpha-tubulin suppressor-like RCC1 family protein